jgi:hypothetical protein
MRGFQVVGLRAVGLRFSCILCYEEFGAQVADYIAGAELVDCLKHGSGSFGGG